MEATDGHGRPLTTTPIAAGWYRLAQRQTDPIDALQRAVAADPTFAVAAVDLLALTGDRRPARLGGPLTGWERHHCEVVAAAVGGGAARAAALLRQHLGEVACDPLALRIVGDATLLREAPACHGRDRTGP
jgi:hypothetical protein